ncbi:MAG: PepSY domain-containing protein [Cytophagales bacterium]|nr:PepSY domain-containing protein [Cytophagales bacterium]
MKVFFRNIHLYLSLACGLVIAIVCFTGAVLVFEKEFQQLLYPERYRVAASGERVLLGQAVAAVAQQEAEAQVSAVKIYADPARTVEISYRKEDGKPKPPTENGGKGGPPRGGEGGKGGGSQAFVNPYTGQVVAWQSQRSPFFFTMFSLHRWLLAGDTGKLIVGVSTSVFLFILLTGIVLWWPQNKKILQQRLKLKLDGGWKRINHDLHIVVGFYAAIFLFAFAFTGLAWSFQWFNDGIYWITGTENVRPEPPLSTPRDGAAGVALDEVFAAARRESPGAEFYNIQLPKDSAGAFSVMLMPRDAAHERATDQLFFDQYSGALIGKTRFTEKNLGQRVRATFYPVHVGSIAGLPGRIVAFLACVAGVTFPVTGVILWLNRLKKNAKRDAKGKTREMAR